MKLKTAPLVQTVTTTTLAVAVWLPAPVWSHSSNERNADLTGLGCTIRMEKSGAMVSLSGDIRGEQGGEGTYSLDVEKKDAAGQVSSRQSGVFRIGADGTRQEGLVSFKLKEIGEVRAVLSISQGNERTSCSLDATGMDLHSIGDDE